VNREPSIMDPLEYFRLKPTRAATVSEISETTASSATSPEERVNFHIGNPVQDRRLTSAYVRMMTGLDIRAEHLQDNRKEDLIKALGWDNADLPKLQFLIGLVQKSGPYMPRGGFSRSAPNRLVTAFHEWLVNQQESLTYDLGKTSGQREIVLSSGGIQESLRVFFKGLSWSLAFRPAHVFLFRTKLPEHVTATEGLQFEELPDDEKPAFSQLIQRVTQKPDRPYFLLLGAITGEESRRLLRQFCLENPLYFVEVNDAPNHRSLAREAKLMNRVLRFITPEIFSPNLRNQSIIFVLGPAEYLSLFETIHFQLKGTPSASEVELVSYVLDQKPALAEREPGQEITVGSPFEALSRHRRAESALVAHAAQIEAVLSRILLARNERVESSVARMIRKAERISARGGIISSIPEPDPFSSLDARALVEQLAANCGSPEWTGKLETAFLLSFLKHHPEYQFSNCTIVSGSSRTALGLLGFHCGIEEVIVPDLSWTYEQCFPRIHSVPLTRDFDLDPDAIIAAVTKKTAADPAWISCGGVVLNNPHNATGQIFAEGQVRRLLSWLLERNVFVVDDLAYQNVTPSQDLKEIKTVRQITDDLVREGLISKEKAARVITIHSLSKTDCLAGARISVVEIGDAGLQKRFRQINGAIRPNIAALFMAYLFYRNPGEVCNAYWQLRNRIFLERALALQSAVRNLPQERNPFAIDIVSPRGGMYPLMIINRLPSGLSLEWLASGLARQGIGLVPLTTFAHTDQGFEMARKAFRLTLGGVDGAEILEKKTRRVLIDLNRLIAEEDANYNRKCFALKPPERQAAEQTRTRQEQWKRVSEAITRESLRIIENSRSQVRIEFRDDISRSRFKRDFLPRKLSQFEKRFLDRSAIADRLMSQALSSKALEEILAREFYKDSLERRRQAFRNRLFDRTVHPTQMCSIKTDAVFERIIEELLHRRAVPPAVASQAAKEMVSEFFGMNVAISSSEESDELLLDLDVHIAAEMFADLNGQEHEPTFLSFWGDWDGSNRPSGQGHRLIAAVLIRNVTRLAALTSLLAKRSRSLKADPDLLSEIEKLEQNNRRFTHLLNEITRLTQHLEERYRGVLPFTAAPGRLRKLGMALHVAHDPLTELWKHNDRLERHMLELRRRRKETLEHYFALNKTLRKLMHQSIPIIADHLNDPDILLQASLYRDLLQRLIITPRITQKLITAHDQFAIDTTVHNIHEINEVSGRYGNPAMVAALQVSMAARPEALIALDRKMISRREQVLRENPDLDLPSVWLVPLFEDVASVSSIPKYLNKLWEYAHQSRRSGQETKDRFAEMVSEIFVAGSDLSQQVGQTAGASLYRQAKYESMLWFAEHGLGGRIRVKLGCGEPMQRQGGYYAEISGVPAFVHTGDTSQRLQKYLSASTLKSTQYATTPMMGIFAGGALRTFQSAIAEKLRYLPVEDLAQLLYHIRESQRIHRDNLVRAGEELVETRLQFRKRGEQELERLTIGNREKIFEEFTSLVTENFRQILYGREEDVIGIYAISYFIARTIPALRDRPTVRPRQDGDGAEGRQILERIAETVPASKYGSMLRAIAHNQAQTAVLGISQLTTGLFRALDHLVRNQQGENDPVALITGRILPLLPVYEILNSLRLYHEVDLRYLNMMERAFPAGNSAFLALREDVDAMSKYLVLFQQELLRRHGIDVGDFFENGKFNVDLLPTLRPDLAVLLQPDLFNISSTSLLAGIEAPVDPQWARGIERLLNLPEEIRMWRSKAWALLEKPLFQRVRSFTELAVSLHSLSPKPGGEAPRAPKNLKLSSHLHNFFRMARTDDEMREFLSAAYEYLAAASEGLIEVPVTIVRALQEVERIAEIEEQALRGPQQDLLRFCLLQIARITGESG
jgi:aspartate/methionine/tyrosine aminotransferase